MRFRGIVKKLVLGYIPRRFNYYGETVHFPYGSAIFQRVCEDGIYERQTTNLILALVQPGTAYLDIGANIGLLSIPILARKADVKVISIEASPYTLPALRRTHSSSHFQNRWTVIAAAVGAEPGETDFWSAGGAWGAYDGIRDTGRGGKKHTVRVPVRTIDEIWQEHGCPDISVMKMDIEGGEYIAFRGAKVTIAKTRPVIVLEWNAQNLAAYNLAPRELLELCIDIGYIAYAHPSLVPITTELVLAMAMNQTETFILGPQEVLST